MNPRMFATTFATAPEFYDLCTAQDEHEQAGRQRTTLIVAAVGGLIVALLLWLLLSH